MPFSERSGERIEPLISLQWFCRMEELAAPAIEVVERDEVRIVPDNYKRVYLDWMRDIRPWCVSRQLWWGHQIPVWYGADGEEIVAESRSRPRPRRASADRPGALSRRRTCSTPGSARRCGRSRPSAGPTRRPICRPFIPTSFLTTAREIIFLWVARMVMMGIEFAGDIPFRDVYVHPVVQAPRRPADVEVARHRDRPARRDRRPRRRRAALRAAGDVLHPGRALLAPTASSRAATSRTRCGTPSRLILLNAGATPSRAAPGGRSRTAGSSRGCSARSPRSRATLDALRLRPRGARASTGSSGPSSATGTWRSSSRASTTATRTPRRTCSTCSSGRSRCCTR